MNYLNWNIGLICLGVLLVTSPLIDGKQPAIYASITNVEWTHLHNDEYGALFQFDVIGIIENIKEENVTVTHPNGCTFPLLIDALNTTYEIQSTLICAAALTTTTHVPGAVSYNTSAEIRFLNYSGDVLPNGIYDLSIGDASTSTFDGIVQTFFTTIEIHNGHTQIVYENGQTLNFDTSSLLKDENNQLENLINFNFLMFNMMLGLLVIVYRITIHKNK